MRRSSNAWPFRPLAQNHGCTAAEPEAHVITKIGMFAFCRRDRFCRCRRCKPSKAVARG